MRGPHSAELRELILIAGFSVVIVVGIGEFAWKLLAWLFAL